MVPTQEDVNAYLDSLAHLGRDVLSQDSELLAMEFLLDTTGGDYPPQALVPYIDEWKSYAQAPCC
jgi:hypothetical protein